MDAVLALKVVQSSSSESLYSHSVKVYHKIRNYTREQEARWEAGHHIIHAASQIH